MDVVWKNTDPDNFQYGREISTGVFEFKEFNSFDYDLVGDTDEEIQQFIDSIFDDSTFWSEMTIDISTLTQKEKEEAISAYYSSMNDVLEIYGDDADFIIAECYFEQSTGFY